MICALVIGKKESSGFPGKNTKTVLGRPMVAYPILAAQGTTWVDRVYVSTDCQDIIDVAQKLGCQVIHRPPHLCTKTALGEDVFMHGLWRIREENPERDWPDLLVLLHANAPTVSAAMIEEGIRTLRDRPELDSAVSVSRYNMWATVRARRIGADGLVHPYLPLESMPDHSTSTCDRDSTGDVWFADVALSVVRPRCLEHLEDGIPPQRWMGRVIYPIRNEGGLDIDYEWQLPMIEYWLLRHGYAEQPDWDEVFRRAF